ncbi:MAG TPA: (5-formylfuran-3-yl)methyl phosphate synthase, partial [Lacipirellulaceae bacterium]|nr:(5-formylfuran-3-yl)methyl phosphate synthase [Lacipirellulaceae bacterium]
KSAGSLFDRWPTSDLQSFLAEVRDRNLSIVLAGSLTGHNITAAAMLNPDFIAVRAAACEGGRGGTVSTQRVRSLKNSVASAHCLSAMNA